MTGIFISYRREDAAWAGRLADDLRRNFGAERVFHDTGSIDPGADFVEALQRALATCGAMLVVIGHNWLAMTDKKGRRRLDNPDDWVRNEVAESLKRSGVRVFPVLVDDADMPDAEDLPEPLQLLTRRQAFPMTARHWANDVGALVAYLKKVPALAEGGAAGTAFRDGDDCPEMVVVPPGEFLMGSPESEEGRYPNEDPQHKVTIARAFAVGRYPVTFAEWDACVAAGGSDHEPEDQGWGRGRQPVINVSWEDAQAYVSWLAKRTGKPYRLLTEAEWEYAARAGTTTRYPWGDEPGTNRANFIDSGSQWSGKQTAPVGSFAANAFGLYDMIGNAWEWVQDCWNASYEGAPADGRAWESGACGRRVLRGGSWISNRGTARVAIRLRIEPGIRYDVSGFRLARTL